MYLITKTIYIFANHLRKYGVNFREEEDARVVAMKKEIQRLGGKVEFKIEQYPDGTWTGESLNLEGIITGGHSTKDVPREIRDAIFTYFGIPPHLCNETLLKADNEPVTLRQQVYV